MTFDSVLFLCLDLNHREVREVYLPCNETDPFPISPNWSNYIILIACKPIDLMLLHPNTPFNSSNALLSSPSSIFFQYLCLINHDYHLHMYCQYFHDTYIYLNPVTEYSLQNMGLCRMYVYNQHTLHYHHYHMVLWNFQY